MPTRVRPRSAINGWAVVISPRAASRMVCVCTVSRSRVRDRVARVKSSKRSRSVTVRPGRFAARIRRVTRSTRPARVASTSSGGVRAAPDRALRPDRAAALADHDRPRIAVVRERVEMPAGGDPEDRDQFRLVQPRDVPDGPDAVLMEFLRRDRTDAPQHLHVQRMQEVQLAFGRARAAARPAWRPGWRPSPGTWSGRCPTVIGRPTFSSTDARSRRAIVHRRAADLVQPADVEERLVDRDALDEREWCPGTPRRPPCWPPSRPTSAATTTIASGHSSRAIRPPIAVRTPRAFAS